MVYGDKSITPSGPLFESASVEGNKIVISFKYANNGLSTNDGEEPKEFAIAGEDKKFVWAKAKIEGNKIVVSSEEVPQPKYVRYAWAETPVYPNLINKEGLPAGPFRTDK
jgi:sialate O-acetylesterase